MYNKHTNENAISPVIGSILMVAITVILAAIVAAFVFGMAGDSKAGHNIMVKPSYNNGNIDLMYYGGDGNNYLTSITVVINNKTPVEWTPSKVGDIKTFVGPYTSPTDMLVTAYYNDGSNYIVINNKF